MSEIKHIVHYSSDTTTFECQNSNCCQAVRGHCGVLGCKACLPNTSHICKRCGNTMSDHLTRHCKIRYAGIYVLVPIWRQVMSTSPTSSSPSSSDEIVDYHVLCQLRSPTLGGYVLGCGGGVNSREMVRHGVLRELMEEAQLDVLAYPNDGLHMFAVAKDLACYYIILHEIPKIIGPDQKHAWEVNRSFDPWDCPNAITVPNTGHAWLPLTQIPGWLASHPQLGKRKFTDMLSLLEQMLLSK